MAPGTAARTVLSASALVSNASSAIGHPPTLLSVTRSRRYCLPRRTQRLPPVCRASPYLSTSSSSSSSTSSSPVHRPFSTASTASARMTPTPPRQRPGAPSLAPNSRRSYFTYSVAASYIGKDRPFDPSTHVFHFNPYNRLQQQKKGASKRPESGQDAFFVSRVGDTGAVALGVADGVGGWMESGVDPADFSHGLCENMAAAAYDHNSLSSGTTAQEGGQKLSSRQLMQIGYNAVRDDPSVRAGGSTAVVGLLSPDGTFECANLGDSGFVQLRLNAVHACSDPQTHAFNTPYQLSMIPPNLLARMAAFGGAQLSDEPRDAEVTRHQLQHGDVLVFASDGVWDNLFNQEILKLVSTAMAATGAWRRHEGTAATTTATTGEVRAADAASLKKLTNGGEGDLPSPITLQSLIATQITAAAKRASMDLKHDGPFAKEVKRYYPNEVWHGGKVDDICVVVAVVSEEEAAASSSSSSPGSGEEQSESADGPIKSRL